MKRTHDKQMNHDICVEKKATELKNEGYMVEADLEGWPKPPQIEGYIPDIFAHVRKTNVTRICEVETEETINTDREQWMAFKRYADRYFGVYFWLFVATEGGRCVYRSI